jgi:hypothetical protein
MAEWRREHYWLRVNESSWQVGSLQLEHPLARFVLSDPSVFFFFSIDRTDERQ